MNPPLVIKVPTNKNGFASLAGICGDDHDLRQKAEPYTPVSSRIDPFMFGAEEQESATVIRTGVPSQ